MKKLRRKKELTVKQIVLRALSFSIFLWILLFVGLKWFTMRSTFDIAVPLLVPISLVFALICVKYDIDGVAQKNQIKNPTNIFVNDGIGNED